MKTKKKTVSVRTVLGDLAKQEITTKSELHRLHLALATAPMWDTCLFLVRFILTLYSVAEFPIRWAFSARLRRQRKEFRQNSNAQGEISPASPGFQSSPVAGKWLTGLTGLHRRYVTGVLETEYWKKYGLYSRAEGFAEAFGVKLEEELDLDTLVKKVEADLQAACADVRTAEATNFKHLVEKALEVARNKAAWARQFDLWPRDSEFLSWIGRQHGGFVSSGNILTYFFCRVDGKGLPVQQQQKVASQGSPAHSRECRQPLSASEKASTED